MAGRKTNNCADCGTAIYAESKRCVTCANGIPSVTLDAQKVLAMRADGMTYDAIAAAFDVKPHRIFTLVKEHGEQSTALSAQIKFSDKSDLAVKKSDKLRVHFLKARFAELQAMKSVSEGV